ncbi:MAG: BrnA antitoxin family protein [Deltaproteobacteria bacterium]|nr:BrnA antitoxin family protein [Deltaproteobacteria bacterium]
MKKKSLSTKNGQVRSLTREDARLFKPAGQVLPKELLTVLPRKPGQRGPQKEPRKEAVTVRYSREVLSYFRATGRGWQSRMDQALKEWVAGNK